MVEEEKQEIVVMVIIVLGVWALLSIQRGQQENFTDPAPLEGSILMYCNLVSCVITNLSLFLRDGSKELSSLTAVTSWSMIGTGLL